MSESSDYDRSSSWVPTHDFREARSVYEDRAERARAEERRSPTSQKRDILEKKVKTRSARPLIIVSDVTGSMGEWPAEMFRKLPYLVHELKTEYLGEDAGVCWAAVGDAYCSDRYPLQIRPFEQDREKMLQRIQELFIEGGGGTGIAESYELAALYFARNCDMPENAKPIIIFIGDEHPYEFVAIEKAREVVGVTLQRRMSTKEVFEELKQRFAVYLIHKPYRSSSGRNSIDETTRAVYDAWVKLVGADHIASLPEAARVVDVIFGILATETEKEADFRKEIEGRQRADQVETVYEALKTVRKKPRSDGESKKKDKFGRL